MTMKPQRVGSPKKGAYKGPCSFAASGRLKTTLEGTAATAGLHVELEVVLGQEQGGTEPELKCSFRWTRIGSMTWGSTD